MKHLKSVFLTLALASMATVSSFAALTSDSAPITTPASQTTASLSPGARDIAKLVAAGLSEEVVKAYVQNANYTFDLSADNLVQLKGMGFTPAVLVAMLNHDRTVRENTRAALAAAAPSAPATPVPASAPATVYVAPAPTVDSAVYSGLSPYGTWSSSPDYGWYWQPYNYVSYDYIPSVWFSSGYWWNYPGRGWCWSPRSRYHDFGYFHGGYAGSSYHYHSFGSSPTFHASANVGGFHSWAGSSGHFGGASYGHGGFHGGRH